MDAYRLILGDCLEELRKLPENSIDSLVTDPPYGWRFMGKAWDTVDIKQLQESTYQLDKPSDKHRKKGIVRTEQSSANAAAGTYDQTLTGNQAFQAWTQEWAREVYRVLKPGAHILVFCGPRTYHRMASGVEDAGFEIRDQMQWLFGSGFPKSMNISIAIDKQAGVMGHRGKAFVTAGAGEYKHLQDTSGWKTDPGHEGITSEAKQWQGWGTALKPANEPILLARKPISEKTVAANVLKWGCGGINIDASRIGTNETGKRDHKGKVYDDVAEGYQRPGASMYQHKTNWEMPTQGRFPANLVLSCECETEVHDDQCAVSELDRQSGVSKSNSPKSKGNPENETGMFGVTGLGNSPNDSGGASRFFYCAKASKRERNEGCEGLPEKHAPKGNHEGRDLENIKNHLGGLQGSKSANDHPTIKPIRLMQYLITLVTPPNGTVLDPFMGSGSTGVAALRSGFKFIGIERESEYMDIAKARITNARKHGP